MESLKMKLNEAMASEEKRIEKLSRISDANKRKTLEERFKAERAREQEQISWLLDDYRQLQAIRANPNKDDDADTLRQEPGNNGKTSVAPPIRTMDKDRFKLNVYVKEVNLNKELLHRFQKVDEKVERRYTVSTKTVDESKQLSLLFKKRELLQQLVSVHKDQLNAMGGETFPETRSSRSYYAGAPATVRSNSSSGSSRASWATFATSNNHYASNNRQEYSHRPYRVPSLPI